MLQDENLDYSGKMAMFDKTDKRSKDLQSTVQCLKQEIHSKYSLKLVELKSQIDIMQV